MQGQGTNTTSSIDHAIPILLLETVVQPLLNTNPPFVALDLEYGRSPKNQDNER